MFTYYHHAYLLFILSTLSFISYGQSHNIDNLVPNPGFEEYSSCPDNTAQIYLAKPWNPPEEISSSEFYHLCSNYLNVLTLYQIPHNGEGIAGIHADKGANMGEYKEYIQVRLKEPLKQGSRYCVSFYVSLMGGSRFGFKEMGIYFSNDQINSGSLYTLPYHPQVINNNGPLMDTTNWMLISGDFIAGGGEEWMTVGCFTPGAQMNWVMNFGHNSQQNNFAYYFLDDFSVYECNEPIKADAGNDTAICSGSSVKLGSGQWDGFNYEWHSGTGETFNTGMPVVSPKTSTSYYLAQTDLWGGIAYDTVDITVYDCETLYIPGCFTPDNDQLNDCFRIVNPGDLNYSITIINRWGSLIFEGNQSDCWDGTLKNQKVPEGFYLYYIKITSGPASGKEYKGFVMVLL